MFGKRAMLGLALTDRSVAVAEAVAADGGATVRRAAEFAFPEGLGLQQPAELGKALRQFLRTKGFAALRCSIGVEAKQLAAWEKMLPPSADGSVAQILSLMIEREFALDGKELVFDYAVGPDTTRVRSALLVAVPRRVVKQLSEVAEAAGLTVDAITSSTLALADAGGGPMASDQLVLHLFRGGMELALFTGGVPRLVRRVPTSASSGHPAGDGSVNAYSTDLTDQLRRVVAVLPGGESGDGEPPQLVVCDETGREWPAYWELPGQVALPVTVCQRRGDTEPCGAQFSAASAVALRGVCGRAPAIDFLHSRLAPRKTSVVGRKVVWAAAAVVAVLAAGTLLWADRRADTIEADALRTKLDLMADEVAEAKATVAKVTLARAWYDRRTSYLDCMRELTLAFPKEGSIWATNLAIGDDVRVALSGKAVSEAAVLDLLDRLKANPKLAAVKPLYIRQAGRDGREIAFAMGLAFNHQDGTWSSANGKE